METYKFVQLNGVKTNKFYNTFLRPISLFFNFFFQNSSYLSHFLYLPFTFFPFMTIFCIFLIHEILFRLLMKVLLYPWSLQIVYILILLLETSFQFFLKSYIISKIKKLRNVVSFLYASIINLERLVMKFWQ